MSTHNIRFHGEIKNLLSGTMSDSSMVWKIEAAVANPSIFPYLQTGCY